MPRPAGPLEAMRIVELAGIGPAQHGIMLLSDPGAEVVRIDRPSAVPGDAAPAPCPEILGRGRRSIALDLKRSRAVEVLDRLLDRADVLVDPYRPGVMERLGLGPDRVMSCNPRLVYTRMTGWGQTGPLARAAGHDLNYVALSGALEAIGRAHDAPPVPLNLIADFGGGGMLMALG